MNWLMVELRVSRRQSLWGHRSYQVWWHEEVRSQPDLLCVVCCFPRLWRWRFPSTAVKCSRRGQGKVVQLLVPKPVSMQEDLAQAVDCLSTLSNLIRGE